MPVKFKFTKLAQVVYNTILKSLSFLKQNKLMAALLRIYGENFSFQRDLKISLEITYISSNWKSGQLAGAVEYARL